MNKLLFLDIDGVLNNEYTKECSVTGFRGLDLRLVTKFKNWFSTQEDLSIVLSSTWRIDPVMKQEILDAGILFVGETQRLDKERGWEIERYLLDLLPTVPRFVILDDDSDMLSSQLPFFVQTSPVHGLRDKDLVKAERILNVRKN